MAREGLGVVIALVLCSIIAIFGIFVSPFLHLKIIAAVLVLLTILTVNFFRDPERRIPDGAEIIIAPADGNVIEIVSENESEYWKAEETRITIFLIIFAVNL